MIIPIEPAICEHILAFRQWPAGRQQPVTGTLLVTWHQTSRDDRSLALLARAE